MRQFKIAGRLRIIFLYAKRTGCVLMMKAGVIQYDVSRSLDENIRMVENQLSGFEDGLAVLPELCGTGYLFPNREALAEVAEPVPGGRTVEAMRQLSERYRCSMVFGVAEIENGLIYNTAAVVSRGRYIGKYRKIHLSDFEKKLFASGTKNTVFKLDGLTIGVQICFDLWFPEIAREQLQAGAELFCVPANFGGETSQMIARVRAIENLTPLIVANRVGNESMPGMDASFLGRSTVFAADGTPAATAPDGIPAAVCCEVQPQQMAGNVICRDFKSEIARHESRCSIQAER